MRKIEKPPSRDRWIKKIGITDVQRLWNNIEFNQLVRSVNDSYKYWDKVKYLETPDGFTPEDVWMMAKSLRRDSPYQVPFGEYSFTWYLTSQLQELLHFFDLNIGGSLEARSLIPKEDKHKYLMSSIMEEAIASSQIEGAVTSRRLAKEMLRKNIPPKNKSEQMILNNYRTIQRILEIKDTDLSINTILDIHHVVAKNTMPESEVGAFRTTDDVHVIDASDGSIIHTPPPAADLNALMEGLCQFFNRTGEEPFIHPIVKACVIHFIIGFIHPFADGNGRTARAIYYWYLLKKGYWLTEYMSISRMILRSKAQYARAYQYSEIDEHDLTYFIKYQLRAMRLAFDGLREYIQRKIAEKRQLAELIRLPGVNERQALIIKWYYEEPSAAMSVREIQNRLGVSNQTARNDMQHLKDLGFIYSVPVDQKKETFLRANEFESLLESQQQDKTRL
jgi:Fic family protein